MPTTAPRTDSVAQAFRFVHALLRMSADDIRQVSMATPVNDDVAWWDAVAAVEDRLRAVHLLREAAIAARRATQAVFSVAAKAGLDVDRGVVGVAHAAGDAARALVAGGTSLTPARPLLAPWTTAGLMPEPCQPAGR